MKPSKVRSPQERIDLIDDQIKRCATHYDEPWKYPPLDTMRVINELMWRQLRIAED